MRPVEHTDNMTATRDNDALRRTLFMTPELAARYERYARRKPGTRLERCERLWPKVVAGTRKTPPVDR